MSELEEIMGGKDSPPPCVSISPVQSPKWDKQRSDSEKSVFSRQPSPIEYVPRSKSAVNLHVHAKASQSRSLPRDCNYSPIRTYMECLSPQNLKCAIVGDSGVGKTSMLMSYTVDKFPEKHAPTIYDKFSSEYAVVLKLQGYVDKALIMVDIWEENCHAMRVSDWTQD